MLRICYSKYTELLTIYYNILKEIKIISKKYQIYKMNYMLIVNTNLVYLETK